jgi:hypothetical protein
MCKHEDTLDALVYLAEMEFLRRKRNYLEVNCMIPEIKRALNSIYGIPSAYYERIQKDLYSPRIKNVIFNDPATIVFWEDGTKTVVKAHDEPFDKGKGLSMAIVKKMYGNKGSYFNEIKKWVENEEDGAVINKNTTGFDEIRAFLKKINSLSQQNT